MKILPEQVKYEWDRIKAAIKYFSAEELSTRHTVHLRKVYRILAQKGIKKVKLGKVTLYSEEDFLQAKDFYEKRKKGKGKFISQDPL